MGVPPPGTHVTSQKMFYLVVSWFLTTTLFYEFLDGLFRSEIETTTRHGRATPFVFWYLMALFGLWSWLSLAGWSYGTGGVLGSRSYFSIYLSSTSFPLTSGRPASSLSLLSLAFSEGSVEVLPSTGDCEKMACFAFCAFSRTRRRMPSWQVGHVDCGTHTTWKE